MSSAAQLKQENCTYRSECMTEKQKLASFIHCISRWSRKYGARDDLLIT
jgi:hypothetical protein